MKKIMAIVAAIAMLMTAFAVSAAAEGAVPVTFTAESVTAKPGDVITVDICVSENHYMVNGQIMVNYDPTCLEIVEVWDDPDCPYFEEVNTKIFRSSYMWMFNVPTAGTAKFAFASSASVGTTAGGAMFTLTFKVLDNAVDSEIVVTVPENDMNANNGSSTDDLPVALTFVNGAITIDDGLVKGDIDGNGAADAADATLLFYYVNYAAELTEDQLASADFNRDGAIDLLDAARVFYTVNGLV